MKPDVVTHENPINYKIFLLIAVLIISFQFFLYSINDSEIIESSVSIVSLANPAVASLASFAIFKRYHNSNVFGKAYFALGIAFIMIFLAEVTYLVYDLVLEEDPYPSIADVFFFAFYIFVLVHLKINIKFFNPDTGTITKIWTGAIPVAITSVYSFLSYEALMELNFDYFYGIIFVSIASVAFSYTILGAKSFKGGTLATAWLILVIGVLILLIGDTTYYYLELFEGYTLTHPVNLFWYGGYMVIVYALYKHQIAI